MSKIVEVPIKEIQLNPFRAVDHYPYVERKLEALKRSITDVGLWEGVIARAGEAGYELAFGHHRLEAARQLKLKTVPLIVRTLTDEQMLQFMGRENLEDYNADFLCMLETWEAAVKFREMNKIISEVQAIDIARLLGWTCPRSAGRQEGQDMMNPTARACHAAHALISGGYLERKDLADMTVTAAQQITERAYSRMKELEQFAKETQRPRRDVEQAKRQVAKGAVRTAREVRAGEVSQREIRGRVDLHAYRFAKETKRAGTMPLFARFGTVLADSLRTMLDRDTAAAKLDEIRQSLNLITTEEDCATLRKIQFELGELETRCATWQHRLTPKNAKVVSLLKLTDRKGA